MELVENFRRNALRYMTENKISTTRLAGFLEWKYQRTFSVLYEKPNLTVDEVEKVCNALGVDPIAMMED